jgi:hypothetical protein
VVPGLTTTTTDGGGGGEETTTNARIRKVTCSDKLLQWNILGLQGGLLSSLIEEPVYLRRLVYCCLKRLPLLLLLLLLLLDFVTNFQAS